MKKIQFIFLVLLSVTILFVTALYKAKDATVSAQSQVVEAADRITSGKVEYMKASTSKTNYTVHVRDKVHLMEVSETYLDGELQTKIVVSEGGKRVTSIGRDHATGKLAGTTWLLPEHIAAENARILKISLLEKQKEELKQKKWNRAHMLQENGQTLLQATSKQADQKEIVFMDESTGLPVKREVYLKDRHGKWRQDAERIEEYKYLDSLPVEFISFEHVEIKERPAPVKKDELFAG
ncbi:hypothetical protein J25TS5_50320 [Paenibacillus faecis]|uniref:hypothetical protein n=1 Tax=Paenibacillus faecis TaxID=862114 RepID=UPI001B233D1B|nr:hypothetical protein [Paenibacillus faecis]GIO88100.1 hypothetical protein J25TS5_50320 [Paenibacillus faecis]